MQVHPIASGADVVLDDLQAICTGAAEEFATMAGGSLLIVGGGGFLGHYLVKSVLHWNTLAKGDAIRVTLLDNWIRGVPSWLAEHEGDTSLTLRTGDITQPLPDDLGHHDWIIHAASIASPIYYRKFPIETMDANVGGLRRLLDYSRAEAADGRPVSGFLFYSTSEIYGDPDPANIPTPETYRGNVSCTGPRACYDESKRYGETLCVSFAEVYDLPIRVARPFNNYGPGLKITDRRVIPDFVRNILAGDDIVMLSSGSPTRTFCYITDAIVGYYKVLVKGRNGEAYNIGTEQPEITMADLARRLTAIAAELWDYKGTVKTATSEDPQYLIDNPNRRCPIIAKARAELGYEPLVDIDDGLRRTMLWYGDNSQAEES
jgi:UDP-glucuronate decarboxylase